MVLILIYLLPVACSTAQPAITPTPPTATFTSIPPTATNTPVPPTATATDTPAPRPPLCEGVEGTCVEVRFEEDGCTNVGPEIATAGQITLIFSNYNSIGAGVDLEILDEGKTWDDMRGWIGREPATGAVQAEWSKDVLLVRMSPGGTTTRQLELTAGTYVAICWRGSPHLVWLGGQLIVED